MADMDRSGFVELDRILALVRRTRRLLDGLVEAGALPEGGADYLETTTLPHVERVRSGFTGWLRAESVDVTELRWLIRRVAELRVEPPRTPAERMAAAAELLAERDLAVSRGPRPGVLASAEPWDLAALAHARLVLAAIPRTPPAAVRFPAWRRTYADIPTPRSPAELATRIDELERLLWIVVTGRARARAAADPAFRRTYGFFDTADRLGLGAFAA